MFRGHDLAVRDSFHLQRYDKTIRVICVIRLPRQSPPEADDGGRLLFKSTARMRVYRTSCSTRETLPAAVVRR